MTVVFSNQAGYFQETFAMLCLSRIIQDNSEGNSMHNQALQTLQERLHDAETALWREQEGYKQMQVRRVGVGIVASKS